MERRKCNSLRSAAAPLHCSLSLSLTLFFLFSSVSVVMDRYILIAVGCACTIDDVVAWVDTTVLASADPSGSNHGERERMFQ